jgi:alkylation response protein AidB-like acyl-CoA dehydrogenase
VVFACTEATPGLVLPEYPQLLALQATASTAPVFDEAKIAPDHVLTGDFTRFVASVFPTFLLLQSAFCWGLTRRALSEAEAALRGPAEVLRPDLHELQSRAQDVEHRLRAMASHPDRTRLTRRDLLALRLAWGRLSVEAVALEQKAVGGRGYMLLSGTARRLREAAFLPVQAPTEVQLRWLLSRCD